MYHFIILVIWVHCLLFWRLISFSFRSTPLLSGRALVNFPWWFCYAGVGVCHWLLIFPLVFFKQMEGWEWTGWDWDLEQANTYLTTSFSFVIPCCTPLSPFSGFLLPYQGFLLLMTKCSHVASLFCLKTAAHWFHGDILAVRFLPGETISILSGFLFI